MKAVGHMFKNDQNMSEKYMNTSGEWGTLVVPMQENERKLPPSTVQKPKGEILYLDHADSEFTDDVVKHFQGKRDWNNFLMVLSLERLHFEISKP